MTASLLSTRALVSRLCRSRTSLRPHHSTFATVTDAPQNLPLSGVRVLELGQLIAGPFAGQLLGQFGAEVIKVEPPKTGDPLRVWRELDVDGTSPWFRSIARNKKSVAIDMRKPEGRELVKQLAIKSDVIIENFKPGTLERWGLGPADLHPHNPSLIFTRVSGYGQTGPWAPRPGYASVCEAESGFRYINGFPDPDTQGLAAFGTVLALLGRQKQGDKPAGTTVDVSIVESMLNLMEGIIPEYDRKGKRRGPSGSSVTGIVPTNAYPCLPDPSAPGIPTYVVIGANGDSIYNRLMQVVKRPDLTGPSYQQNHHRVARQAEIEKAISDWTSTHTVEEVIDVMNQVGVPVGRVVTVKEVVEGEQIKARGAVRDVWVGDKDKGEGWSVKMQGTFPVLDGVDAQPKWAGPNLGAHTDAVLTGDLGLSSDTIAKLRSEGIIG
ncbi:putative L-carnitine dehydratase bile acid-inducible protein F [Lyophyllum shimeji]|uniref:L-carnitine dehydratase bile acid-inducible protein F n=1 Tax=Lyophyllum shimeji TaxID=47721 RepID=A0A9P3UM55_LYOSH|nr:putative L-carnitine dehydratase bile acid-inducible protein F [Lyophyllum shimeji]